LRLFEHISLNRYLAEHNTYCDNVETNPDKFDFVNLKKGQAADTLCYNYFAPQTHLHADWFFKPFEDKNEFHYALLRAILITFECIQVVLTSLFFAVYAMMCLILAPIILPVKVLTTLIENDKNKTTVSVLDIHLGEPIKILLVSTLSILVNLLYLPIAAPIALAKLGTRKIATLCHGEDASVYKNYSSRQL
tara:strand:+ start:1595 stop:2170 length:576 start_codon:yes stop_codon:yes gene_type:complete